MDVYLRNMRHTLEFEDDIRYNGHLPDIFYYLYLTVDSLLHSTNK
jgi:hypothetical protein